MRSEDITYVQVARGDLASARPRAGLTEAQKTGRACVVCGGTGANEHVGYVDDRSVKIHVQCVENWRMGSHRRPDDR